MAWALQEGSKIQFILSRAALYYNCSICKECQGWIIGDVRNKMGEIKWPQRAEKWGGNCTSWECTDNTGNVDLNQHCVKLKVRALCPLVCKCAPGSMLQCLALRSWALGEHGPAEVAEEDTVLLLPEIAQKKGELCCITNALQQQHVTQPFKWRWQLPAEQKSREDM